jgi:chromosomal replication initiator protein
VIDLSEKSLRNAFTFIAAYQQLLIGLWITMESLANSVGYMGATNPWQSLAPQLKARVSEQNFEIWLSSVRFLNLDERRLLLQVPNTFFQEYLTEHYTEVIREELGRKYGLPLHVEFTTHQEKTKAEEPAPAAPVISITEAKEETPEEALYQRYRFDTFVVGPSNQFAHAACHAVAQNPGGNYNPLFLFGGVGLGKTHLLLSIGARIREKNPKLRVRYLNSEAFVNEVINSIRYERVEAFHRKYREECDVLLVDDIQFIAGKDRSQTEFFHTFNALHAAKRQIVVTCDKMPQEIPNLELRLKSRLQWGLVADILPPDMETRVAILRKKADETNFALPDDVALFLATHIVSNVRELEGALARLSAYVEMRQLPVSLQTARESLRHLEKNASPMISIEAVQRAVCAYYDVNMASLKGPKRTKEIIIPRQVAMYLSRKLTGASYPEIGARFQKDHATVINAVTKIERLLLSELPLRSCVENISSALQSR